MSEMKTYKATIEGIRPLLMHSGRLADPLDPMALRLAELTHKKKKTPDDHERIARAEWEGGLYVLEDQVVLPGLLLDATLRDGAKQNKQGKAVVAGVEIAEEFVPLQYDGPKSWKKLYDVKNELDKRKFVDRRGTKLNGRTTVIRTRPRFNEWSATFTLNIFDFAEVGPKDVQRGLEHAGRAVGIGDFRPKFGLFTVKSFEEVR